MAKLQITLVRSLIGRNEKQRATVASLGLSKIRQTVVLNDSPAIRGMVNQLTTWLKWKKFKTNESSILKTNKKQQGGAIVR